MTGTIIGAGISIIFSLAMLALSVFIMVVMVQILFMALKIMKWYIKKNDIV